MLFPTLPKKKTKTKKKECSSLSLKYPYTCIYMYTHMHACVFTFAHTHILHLILKAQLKHDFLFFLKPPPLQPHPDYIISVTTHPYSNIYFPLSLCPSVYLHLHIKYLQKYVMNVCLPCETVRPCGAGASFVHRCILHA